METEWQGQRVATRGTPRGGRDLASPRDRSAGCGSKPPRARSVRSQSGFLQKSVLAEYNRDPGSLKGVWCL
jgi:hypothetical protein